MKKLLLASIMIFCITLTKSQDFTKTWDIQFNTEDDYRKQEPQILTCAKFILDHPCDNNDLSFNSALKVLILWMTGTPDYSFNLDTSINQIVNEKNPGLLGVYMACMTEYVLENKVNGRDLKQIKINSYKRFIKYCEDKKNNVFLTKEIKGLIRANKRNELEKYLEP